MAEAKNTAETKGKARVLAGTFPAAATDQAKKLLSGMEAAGLKGYKMGAAPDFPGYIQVAQECNSKEEAEAAVKAAADKKINVCICE